MSQTEDQTYETIEANFEFVKNDPVQAIFTISPNVQDLNYTFQQDVPSAKWVINHKLAKFPSVTIINSAGEQVYADVTYVDGNTVEVTFNGAFAGKAYIN